MADEEKKIFIDEDWKAQVQREKEEAAARKAAAASEEDTKAAAASEEDAIVPETVPEPAEDGEEALLEASFEALVGSLATQCMFSLGLIAPQGAQQVMVDLDQAKFSIDTLVVLREKTRGNLSAEEEGALTEAVSELQRVYTARVQQFQDQEMRQAGVDLTNLRGGEG
jgi:hypothetical protein